MFAFFQISLRVTGPLLFHIPYTYIYMFLYFANGTSVIMWTLNLWRSIAVCKMAKSPPLILIDHALSEPLDWLREQFFVITFRWMYFKQRQQILLLGIILPLWETTCYWILFRGIWVSVDPIELKPRRLKTYQRKIYWHNYLNISLSAQNES